MYNSHIYDYHNPLLNSEDLQVLGYTVAVKVWIPYTAVYVDSISFFNF
jgi:hypothetical protein